MKVSSIQEYLDSIAGEGKAAVTAFMEGMAARFPERKPRISFAMPMWYLGGKMNEGYVAVSVAKHHYTVHFLNQSVVEGLKEKAPKCRYGKGCVNIPYGDEESLSAVWTAVEGYMAGAPSA